MSYTILIVLTILGWGVGSVCYKVANDNLHPIMVSTIVTAIYVVFTPVIFLVSKFPKTVNTNGVIFAIAGGLCMAVGSLAYFFALKKGAAGEVTTITALYPAVTLALSMCFLREQITFRQGIGIILALVSFIFLSKK